MSTRMPSRVKVGSKHIIIERLGIIDYDRADVGEVTHGLFDFKNSRITITPRLPAAEARRVLVHELEHAIIDEAQLNFSVSFEEKLVTATTPILLATLRDNPALVRYLTEKG